MARVYNLVGSYTVLMDELRRNGITEFRSVDELLEYYRQIDFEKSCTYAKHKEQLVNERVVLPEEIRQSAERIEKVKADTYASLGRTMEELQTKRQALRQGHLPLFNRLRNSIKRCFLDVKIRKFESTIESTVAIACESYHVDLNHKVDRLNRLSADFDNAVSQSCAPVIREFDRHKSVISGLKPYIYGAIGELKVANVLQRMPESSVLINDFAIEFSEPLYFKQEDQYISSVQVDHLLITQAGVFVIETKNWSEQTVNRDDIFSPINQVRRAGFALYVMLSDSTEFIGLDHPWGKQKIPVRNVVVFTGHRPTGEYQYVKILGLNELEGYIKYFKPIYSVADTERIANYFVDHFVI